MNMNTRWQIFNLIMLNFYIHFSLKTFLPLIRNNNLKLIFIFGERKNTLISYWMNKKNYFFYLIRHNNKRVVMKLDKCNKLLKRKWKTLLMSFLDSSYIRRLLRRKINKNQVRYQWVGKLYY